MAINKRFTHLNHSGSNHSILDAESGYVTGTFQVGPGTLGSDVNFFVSGNMQGKDLTPAGVGVFGGDLVVSGDIYFDGTIYGIIPGSEAYWSSPSLGVIKAETSSSMVEVPYLSSSTGVEISGSAIFAGNGGVTLASDTIFYVSGSTENNSGAKAVFGGTTFISGNIQIPFDSKIEARNSASNDWLTIAQYVDATGFGYGNQILILGYSDANPGSGSTGMAILGDQQILAIITGSNQGYFSGSYTFPQGITASIANVAPTGTGRGLLKFGGLDIGPITGSVTLIAPNPGNWILSGSILSASFGVWDGTNAAVVRHEFHILGIGTDSGGGVQTFAATYLVMSNISTTGVQTVAVGGVTELSREISGSFASAWDVNITADCSIEVSASIDAGDVQWYAQRVKEMSLNTAGSRT